MKVSFTPGQVETGKKLIKWLVKDHKYEQDQARTFRFTLKPRYVRTNCFRCVQG